MLQTYCRVSVARKEHKCIACDGLIKIGEPFIRFIPRTMANEIIHIECYAYDNQEPFLVAVDYKPYWNAETVLVNHKTLKENMDEIKLKKRITLQSRSNAE